ncbi:TadE/TadG family type IV pilus assembly protein [Duganella sp. P38]|uniref:TadE/TadG family type IV pilus assembly protein n=1 Tax=Duganella sp. P38 TaxID=3423949 RepID=UPI003D7B8149
MRRQRRARGATVAEFALAIAIFLGVVFFVLEAARALYLWNTLQEVTRRAAHAAAVSDFSNPAAMDGVRQSAILRDSAGPLALGMPITDAHVRIDYLSLARGADGSLTPTPIAAGALPACPVQARINCAAHPLGGDCIRMVRARICAPGAEDCGAVAYQPIFPVPGFSLTLPQSPTTSRAESLGFRPGSTLCP